MGGQEVAGGPVLPCGVAPEELPGGEAGVRVVGEAGPQGGQGGEVGPGRAVGAAELQGAPDPGVGPQLGEVAGPVVEGGRGAVRQAVADQVGEGAVRCAVVAAVGGPVVDQRDAERPVDDVVGAHIGPQRGRQQAVAARVHPQPGPRAVRQ